MFHLSFSFCSIASFPSKHKSFLSFKFKTNKTLSISCLGCKVSQWCMYWNNLQRNLLHKVIYISLQFLNVCKVFKIDFNFYISDLNAIPREELLMAPVHLDLVFAVRCKYWKISNISKNKTFFTNIPVPLDVVNLHLKTIHTWFKPPQPLSPPTLVSLNFVQLVPAFAGYAMIYP